MKTISILMIKKTMTSIKYESKKNLNFKYVNI
jgi:hypothetical protein